MATNEFKQATLVQPRFLNQHILFKKSSNHTKLQRFQLPANKIQAYCISHQQKGNCCPATPPSSSDKSQNQPCSNNPDRHPRDNRILFNDHGLFLADSQEGQRRPSAKRAFSSNKFDLLTTREARRKGKKLKANIFEYAKGLKKQSTSKKSTDESSSTPVEHLKAENEQYREIIRNQETRMKKLEYAIHEEKKKHELQKHIYNQNIEKLKKIAGMQAPHLLLESHLTSVQDEDYDSLSIESN